MLPRLARAAGGAGRGGGGRAAGRGDRAGLGGRRAAGRRTILVECDLARPRLAAHVGLAAAPGLHEYLRWEAEPADVLQPVAARPGPAADGAGDPLVCVCAGRPAAKAETLLGLQSFAHMVEKLRGAYELVLLLGAAGSRRTRRVLGRRRAGRRG